MGTTLGGYGWTPEFPKARTTWTRECSCGWRSRAFRDEGEPRCTRPGGCPTAAKLKRLSPAAPAGWVYDCACGHQSFSSVGHISFGPNPRCTRGDCDVADREAAARFPGWSLGDLRMEKDRRLRVYETASARVLEAKAALEAAELAARGPWEAFREVDRAIAARKAEAK